MTQSAVTKEVVVAPLQLLTISSKSRLLQEKTRLCAPPSAVFARLTVKKCPYTDPMHRPKTAYFPISFQERISPEAACILAPKRFSQIPIATSDTKLPKKVVAQPKSLRYIRGQRPSAVRAPCGHPLSQQAWHPRAGTRLNGNCGTSAPRA